MRYLFSFIFFALLFIGCSGGDAQTTGSSAASYLDYDKRVVLYTNETREVELGIDLTNSYHIESSSERSSDKVSYSVQYTANNTRPTLELKGVSAGEEVVNVISTSSDGDQTKVSVSVLVVEETSDGDEISGDSIDSNGTVPDGGGDDGGDNGGDDPTAPPTAPGDSQAVFDRYACVKTIGFNTVTDTYENVEGTMGSDGAGYVRSVMIRHEDSSITLYYPTLSSYSSTPPKTYAFPRYNFTTKEGVRLIFDVEIAVDILGQKEYAYVDSNGYCLRINIPTSEFVPPSTSVTWVTGY